MRLMNNNGLNYDCMFGSLKNEYAKKTQSQKEKKNTGLKCVLCWFRVNFTEKRCTHKKGTNFYVFLFFVCVFSFTIGLLWGQLFMRSTYNIRLGLCAHLISNFPPCLQITRAQLRYNGISNYCYRRYTLLTQCPVLSIQELCCLVIEALN